MADKLRMPDWVRKHPSEQLRKHYRDLLRRVNGQGDSAATLKNLFGAHTILKADTPFNPEALTMAGGTLLGRQSGGEIDALVTSEVLDLLNIAAQAEAVWEAGTGTNETIISPAKLRAAFDAYTAVTPHHAPRNFNDKGIAPYFYIASWPGTIYDSAGNKTYTAWEGIVSNTNVSVARIKAYDHSAGTWSTMYDIGYWLDEDDAHGQPVLCQDGDGYLYAFFGAHNADLQWAISQSARSITAWNPQTALTSANNGYTYPKPVLVGSDIHLLLRDTITASSKRPVVHLSGTPSEGTLSFGSATTLVDMGSNTRCYVGEVHAVGTDLHFTMTVADSSDTERTNVYYFIYETDTGGVTNRAGTTTIASGSLPVSASQADANFRVVNTRTNRTGGLPSLQFDTNSNPHILYMEGFAGDYFLKHQVWSGTSWSTAAVLAHIVDPDDATGFVNFAALVPGASGEMEAWYVQNEGSVQGGDMVRRVRNSSGTWGPQQTMVPTGTYPFAGQHAVFNGDSSFRVAFCERVQSGDYSANKKSLKLYGYGDNGFIKAPTTYDYQHLEDGDETAIVGVNPNSDAIDELTGRRAAGTGVTGEISLVGGVNVESGKVHFDGTDDYITLGDSSVWQLSGDFTIICRGVVFDSVTGVEALVAHWNSPSDKGFLFHFNGTTNLLRMLISTDGSGNSTTGVSWTPSAATSYDIAVDRKDGVVRFYVDGSQQGSDVNDAGSSFNSTQPLSIGTYFSSGTATDLFGGTMDEVRIITNKALLAS